MLNKLSVPVQPLNNDLDKTMRGLLVVKGVSVSGQYLSNATRKVFDRAQKQAGALDDEYISSEHLLIAIAGSKDEAGELLKDRQVTKEQILKVLKDVRGSQKVDDHKEESRYNALEKYARDMNA